MRASATTSPPRRRSSTPWTASLLAGVIAVAPGCIGFNAQLPPADLGALEKLETREAREAAYEEERIRVEFDPRGKRFYKGDDPDTPKRGWQSLDATLRSEATSASALPEKQIRASKVLAGVALASGLVMVAGAAATAREALNLGRVTGPAAILLAGAGVSLSFGIAAGVVYGKARKGYENAVDVYNDALGLRLGLLDENGQYIPPPGTLLNEDGFIILRDEVPVTRAEVPETPADGAEAEAPPVEGPDAPEPAAGPDESPAERGDPALARSPGTGQSPAGAAESGNAAPAAGLDGGDSPLPLAPRDLTFVPAR